jgi:hypothetical protein
MVTNLLDDDRILFSLLPSGPIPNDHFTEPGR